MLIRTVSKFIVGADVILNIRGYLLAPGQRFWNFANIDSISGGEARSSPTRIVTKKQNITDVVHCVLLWLPTYADKISNYVFIYNTMYKTVRSYIARYPVRETC